MPYKRVGSTRLFTSRGVSTDLPEDDLICQESNYLMLHWHSFLTPFSYSPRLVSLAAGLCQIHD
jgi:hypothetical protein